MCRRERWSPPRSRGTGSGLQARWTAKSSLDTKPGTKDATPMTQWEYASLRNDGPASREALNELGNDGWELVSVLQGKDTGQFLYVFKRPKAAE